MQSKAPVLLVLLIDSDLLRWFVGAIDLQGAIHPLLCSEVGDLSPYQGEDFDNQVSFLRHRMSGVLQRGFDRVWARNLKPRQILILFSDNLPDTTSELTQRVANHFVEWMMSPSVVVFASHTGLRSLEGGALTPLAGTLDESFQSLVQGGVMELCRATGQSDLWEVSPRKVSTFLAQRAQDQTGCS